MSFRRDAALAGVVLAAAAVAFLATDTAVSPRWVAIGGVGTIGFEALAARRPDAVRRRWERPGVQAVAVVIALAAVGLGARLAPSTLLSAALGALSTYLLVLGCVAGYRRVENG